jgi:hypothetical protein
MFETHRAKALLRKYGSLDKVDVSMESLRTRVNSRVFAILLGTLRCGRKERRAEAARVLGILGDARAAGPLAAALEDGERWVRFRAAEALGELKDPGSTDMLIKALEDGYYGVRKAAACALGGMKTVRAVPPLVKALGSKCDDRFGQARLAILQALESIGDPSAVELLVKALESGDGCGKEMAAEALGMLHDARAAAPLIRALGEPADAIRRQAAKALALLGESQWQGCVTGDLRGDLFRLADLKDPRAAEAFGRALGSADDFVVKTAADASGYYTGGDVGEALNAAFLRGGSDVRKHIAAAFVKRNDARAVEPLLEALAQERTYTEEVVYAGDYDEKRVPETKTEAEFILWALAKLKDSHDLNPAVGDAMEKAATRLRSARA